MISFQKCSWCSWTSFATSWPKSKHVCLERVCHFSCAPHMFIYIYIFLFVTERQCTCVRIKYCWRSCAAEVVQPSARLALALHELDILAGICVSCIEEQNAFTNPTDSQCFFAEKWRWIPTLAIEWRWFPFRGESKTKRTHKTFRGWPLGFQHACEQPQKGSVDGTATRGLVSLRTWSWTWQAASVWDLWVAWTESFPSVGRWDRTQRTEWFNCVTPRVWPIELRIALIITYAYAMFGWNKDKTDFIGPGQASRNLTDYNYDKGVLYRDEIHSGQRQCPCFEW